MSVRTFGQRIRSKSLPLSAWGEEARGGQWPSVRSCHSLEQDPAPQDLGPLWPGAPRREPGFCCLPSPSPRANYSTFLYASVFPLIIGVYPPQRAIEIVHLKAYIKCLINTSFTLHAKYCAWSIKCTFFSLDPSTPRGRDAVPT